MSCYTILILLHPTFLPYDPFAVLNSFRKKMSGCQKFIVAITRRFELPSDYMQFAERTAPLSIQTDHQSNATISQFIILTFIYSMTVTTIRR